MKVRALVGLIALLWQAGPEDSEEIVSLSRTTPSHRSGDTVTEGTWSESQSLLEPDAEEFPGSEQSATLPADEPLPLADLTITMNDETTTRRLAEQLSLRFGVDDIAASIRLVRNLRDHFGIRNPLQERVIDRLAEKHGASLDSLRKSPPVRLTIGTVAPRGSTRGVLLEESVSPFLEWETRGLLGLGFLLGGGMGTDEEMVEKMVMGRLDGCDCTSLGLTLAAPQSAVLTLPLLTRNYEEMDFVLERLKPHLRQALEEGGFTLVSFQDWGTSYFYFQSRGTIPYLSALRGLKTANWSGPAEGIFITEIGASPVKTRLQEILQSFQSGNLEGVLAPPLMMVALQWYRAVQSVLSRPMYWLPSAVLIGKPAADRVEREFPAGVGRDLLALLADAGESFEPRFKRVARHDEEVAMMGMRKRGLREISLGASDLEAIEAAAKRTWAAMAGKYYPQELFDEVQRVLAEFRAR